MDRILSSREQEVRAEGDQQSPMIEKDGKDGEVVWFSRSGQSRGLDHWQRRSDLGDHMGDALRRRTQGRAPRQVQPIRTEDTCH